jgi:hypothetical protein
MLGGGDGGGDGKCLALWSGIGNRKSRCDIRARIRICAWVYAYAYPYVYAFASSSAGSSTLPMPISREARAQGGSLLCQGQHRSCRCLLHPSRRQRLSASTSIHTSSTSTPTDLPFFKFMPSLTSTLTPRLHPPTAIIWTKSPCLILTVSPLCALVFLLV